jgi:hypothetical protein
MSTPSLLNIPYVIKAGTLYSQIPETGAGDFAVTRTTSPTANRSTRVNANGFIELVNDNVPRLDYPLGGAVNGCPALLVEPAGTNICLQSEDFSTTWVPGQQGSGSNAAITTNVATAPDGTATADLIVFNRGAGNTSNDRSTLTQQPTVVSGTVYTQSVYLKAATSGDFGKQIGIRNVAQGGVLVITLTANWVRYSKTETAPSTAGFWQFINIGGSTADNTVSVHAWGAQLEVGSVATSYIPTTTQAITRGADVIRKTGITSLIGQSEGTVYFEVEVTNEARTRWICTLDSASNSLIQIYIGGGQNITATILNAGSTVMAALNSSVQSVGYHKVAFAYNTATNGCIMYIDGVQNPATTQTVVVPGLPTFNDMSVGNFRTSTTDTLKAHVRAGAVYPNRLSNSELATLTTP